jgi:predicted transcriptional regulator
MPPKRPVPTPTDFELEILQVLWERDDRSVREIHEILSRRRELVYTTVLKTLQIMTEKGLVRRIAAGKAHLYSAAIDRSRTQDRLIDELSTRLFSGSAAQLAMHALSAGRASEDELQALRALIDRKSRP